MLILTVMGAATLQVLSNRKGSSPDSMVFKSSSSFISMVVKYQQMNAKFYDRYIYFYELQFTEM